VTVQRSFVLCGKNQVPFEQFVRSLAGESSVDEAASSNLEFSSSKPDPARYPSSGYAQVPDTLSHEEQDGRL
jgi:hypothetical protein